MLRNFLAAAALLVPLAFAPSAQAHGMNRDQFIHRASGYHVSTRSNGREMCLEGRHPRTGETFDLHVSADGEVTGIFEGRQVSFTADRRNRSR